MSTYPVTRKPRTFGYICLPAHSQDGADRTWRQRIANYAAVEGLSLLRIFVDDRDSGGEQFSQMLGLLEQNSVRHLIVPSAAHLGRAHQDDGWMVQHILSTQLQLSVHAIEDAAPAGPSPDQLLGHDHLSERRTA